MSIEKTKNSTKSADFVQSLKRGLAVIQAFSEEHPSLTISEAAKITGISRPAVRRILLTLKELGYAECANDRFSLTVRTLSLGYAYLSSKNIWHIAQPHMKHFVDKTGESSSISVLDETEVVYVARVATKRIMTIAIDVGTRLPAHATSMGQVLLAHLSEAELEEYFKRATLESFTNNTITDKSQLLNVFEQIRENGWIMVEQQLEEGLRSIAVPIRNSNGKVIAAINCSAHAGRISSSVIQEQFLPLLLKTAEKISKDLATYDSSLL
ncbi:IclR family transcriptional regulator C-terminal domain-containing protein [Siminovitchia sp. FSL H7-0308]|uniref:IclR family transcriptional regulator domain-containing protein n=1 Tax=Siminovitchia sp. FSL H7-0308 TaxID=2921432 RepID=UPI0030EC8106